MIGVLIKDVELWAIHRGIGHAVAYARDHYVGTACNSFANFVKTKKRPKRICRKCRSALKRAHKIEPTNT